MRGFVSCVSSVLLCTTFAKSDEIIKRQGLTCMEDVMQLVADSQLQLSHHHHVSLSRDKNIDSLAPALLLVNRRSARTTSILVVYVTAAATQHAQASQNQVSRQRRVRLQRKHSRPQ
ncbi:hypothetical protein KC323_g7586 [Hortaea werneckii]|nr:hypothetical protein KC323_g7586 [Hortaea werneckii]